MKKLNLKLKNNKSGITLIALVVTIIVLLILAGLSVAMLTGENGILNKASTAKNKNNDAELEEEIKLEVMGAYNEQGKINFTELKNNLEGKVRTSSDKFPLEGLLANNKKVTIREDGKVIIGDYIKDGLILYYDALNNTGNGYDSNSNIWKDLSENGNDGILTNINNTAESGWKNNGLKLDGIDDYVEIKPNNLKGLQKGTVIVDFEIYDWNEGEEYNTLFFLGNELSWPHNHIQISEDQYTASRFNTTISNDKESTANRLLIDVNLNKYKHVSLTWNGVIIQNFDDGIKKDTLNSSLLPAENSTVCFLGRNYHNETRNLNCKINSLKIYNRDLTDTEIQKIYELDYQRYN